MTIAAMAYILSLHVCMISPVASVRSSMKKCNSTYMARSLNNNGCGWQKSIDM